VVHKSKEDAREAAGKPLTGGMWDEEEKLNSAWEMTGTTSKNKKLWKSDETKGTSARRRGKKGYAYSFRRGSKACSYSSERKRAQMGKHG